MGAPELCTTTRASVPDQAGKAKQVPIVVDRTVGDVAVVARGVAAGDRVVVDGQSVKLTSHEYRLLSYLMHHAGRIVSRGELTEHLYDQDFDRDSNTIEVFVGRLRKKLGVDVIQTVRGLGYLVDPKSEGDQRRA